MNGPAASRYMEKGGLSGARHGFMQATSAAVNHRGHPTRRGSFGGCAAAGGCKQPAIAVDNKLKDQAAILTSLSTRVASRLDACADLANPTVYPYRCPLRSHWDLSRHCQLLEATPCLRAALFAAKAADTQQTPCGGEELPPRTSKLPLFAKDHVSIIRLAAASVPPSAPLSARI